LTKDFVRTPAEGLLGSLVPVGDPAFRIDRDESIGRGLGDEMRQLLLHLQVFVVQSVARSGQRHPFANVPGRVMGGCIRWHALSFHEIVR
jgi:hypothetical protein